MQNDSLDAPTEPRTTPPSAPSLNARLIACGVSESYASLLASGIRKPSLELALDLEEKLGIAPAAWRQGPAAVRAALAVADASRPGSTAPGCPA